MSTQRLLPFLVIACLLPAVGLLTVFLTYPLGLGIWLAFTDTKIGRSGQWIGLENFEYLLEDPLFWKAVFYSVFYTGVATFGKFALGLWLALLLNNGELCVCDLTATLQLPQSTVSRHLAYLKAEGCTEGQGFLFSKPAPIESIEAFVRKARKP
mgnify:CR=1 FL=1